VKVETAVKEEQEDQSVLNEPLDEVEVAATSPDRVAGVEAAAQGGGDVSGEVTQSRSAAPDRVESSKPSRGSDVPAPDGGVSPHSDSDGDMASRPNPPAGEPAESDMIPREKPSGQRSQDLVAVDDAPPETQRAEPSDAPRAFPNGPAEAHHSDEPPGAEAHGAMRRRPSASEDVPVPNEQPPLQERVWIRPVIRDAADAETALRAGTHELTHGASVVPPAGHAEPTDTLGAPLDPAPAARIPLDEGRLLSDIVQQGRMLTRPGGVSEVRIALHPPELGAIMLRLTLRDDRLHAEVQVEQPALRPIIEAMQHRVRQTLAGDGISLERFDVGLRGETGSQADRRLADPGASPRPGDGASAGEGTPEVRPGDAGPRLAAIGVGSGMMDYFA